MYQCKDVECGMTWESHITYVRTLSPSGKPNPRFPPTTPLSRPPTETRPPGG